jgi:hypothetical protein
MIEFARDEKTESIAGMILIYTYLRARSFARLRPTCHQYMECIVAHCNGVTLCKKPEQEASHGRPYSESLPSGIMTKTERL